MSGTELDLPETLRLEDAPGADVPPDAPPEAPAERAVNPREEQMRRIAAHYEEQQRAEVEQGDQLFREAAEREAAAADERETDPSSASPERRAAPGPSPAPASPQQAAPALRTISLQGHELQVTEEQYAHLASVGALANLAMEQQAHAPASPQHVAQPAPQYGPSAHGGLARDRAEAILHRISYGTPEDGVAALQEFAAEVSSRNDPAAVAAAATQQALQSIELQSNLRAIGTEFPDVFNHRDRSLVAAIRLTEIRQRDAALGQQRPALDQYREACHGTLSGLGIAPERQPTRQSGLSVQSSADRHAAKRAAPRNPMSVSRAASLGEERPRPPSGSQIVDQIRRQRGQMT